MRKPSSIAATLAAAVVVTSMFGASAFADPRHRDETDRSGRYEQKDSRSVRDPQSRGPHTFGRRENVPRIDRGRAEVRQAYVDTRAHGGRDNRIDGRDRGYDSRRPVTTEGRVRRIEHERDGYRVWLDRDESSYWVPEARFRRFPLRVGLSIRLGGWWDPSGYVNVYDIGPIGGLYSTSGDVRGIVESIDYGRGTAVVRDDDSAAFVTILLSRRALRLRDLRPGDYVDFSGAWTRSGIFDAYALQYVRGRY